MYEPGGLSPRQAVSHDSAVSIPAAISLLITAIYNIVDRMFVGNVNGTSALAGLSVCFPLSYLMMAFGLMCSAGGSTFSACFPARQSANG